MIKESKYICFNSLDIGILFNEKSCPYILEIYAS